MRSVRSWKHLRALSLGIVALCAFGVASAQIPTNSGVVKVDDVPIEDIATDTTHVGCTGRLFRLRPGQGVRDGDLRGFVANPLPGVDQTLLTDDFFIGEDDSSGGGGEAGLDASRTYTLDFTGITPAQGIHLPLTVNAPGSQGADIKTATFWVTGCGAPAPTSTSTPTVTSTATATATPTSTSVPPTVTATATPTSTSVPPTATQTLAPGVPPPGTVPMLSFPALALLAMGLAGAALFLIRRA